MLTTLQDTHLLLTGGVEKTLRIYDLNRLDAPPREVNNFPGSVRTVSWLHSDQTILSSCTDFEGVRYAHNLYYDLTNATYPQNYPQVLLPLF